MIATVEVSRRILRAALIPSVSGLHPGRDWLRGFADCLDTLIDALPPDELRDQLMDARSRISVDRNMVNDRIVVND